MVGTGSTSDRYWKLLVALSDRYWWVVGTASTHWVLRHVKIVNPVNYVVFLLN